MFIGEYSEEVPRLIDLSNMLPCDACRKEFGKCDDQCADDEECVERFVKFAGREVQTNN